MRSVDYDHARAALALSRARRWCETGLALAIRREARLTQQEVARAVGTTSVSVCRWESGARRPTGLEGARYGELLMRLAAGDKS